MSARRFGAATLGDPGFALAQARGWSVRLGTADRVLVFMGLSPRTLDRYRVSGDRPAFHRFGSRVRHLAADLEAWASARRLSTPDDGPDGREGKP